MVSAVCERAPHRNKLVVVERASHLALVLARALDLVVLAWTLAPCQEHYFEIGLDLGLGWKHRARGFASACERRHAVAALVNGALHSREPTLTSWSHTADRDHSHDPTATSMSWPDGRIRDPDHDHDHEPDRGCDHGHDRDQSQRQQQCQQQRAHLTMWRLSGAGGAAQCGLCLGLPPSCPHSLLGTALPPTGTCIYTIARVPHEGNRLHRPCSSNRSAWDTVSRAGRRVEGGEARTHTCNPLHAQP